MTNYRIKKPVLTVYMPVFNAGKYLSQSIDSILSQTYKDFEFIIVDDASTDNSWTIIKKYSRIDKRIRAFKNKFNLGVSLTSNIAISSARGKFLARMDADDISSVDRFQKQIDFLKNNPQIVLVGGQCTIIDDHDQIIGSKHFPLSPHRVLMDMLFWAVPVQQGFMMINRSKLPNKFAWYQANLSSAEEIDLFFNLSQFGQFANLPENLYFYRQIPGSLSHQNPKRTFYLTLQSRLNAIKNGHKPSVKSIALNIAQIIAITVLPSSAIYKIWYLIRGISQLKHNTVATLAKIGVKSY